MRAKPGISDPAAVYFLKRQSTPPYRICALVLRNQNGRAANELNGREGALAAHELE